MAFFGSFFDHFDYVVCYLKMCWIIYKYLGIFQASFCDRFLGMVRECTVNNLMFWDLRYVQEYGHKTW